LVNSAIATMSAADTSYFDAVDTAENNNSQLEFSPSISCPPSSLLLSLPPELIHHLLTFLPIPALLSLSRTCHCLRSHALSPTLHRERRRLEAHALAVNFNKRPPLSKLIPPASGIYLTSTHWNARRVERQLTKARLKYRLEHRADVGVLVERGILWGECWTRVEEDDHNRQLVRSKSSPSSPSAAPYKPSSLVINQSLIHPSRKRSHIQQLSDKDHQEVWIQSHLSPRIADAKRDLEKERIRNRLRRWVEGIGLKELERREHECELHHEKLKVKELVRRFRFLSRIKHEDEEAMGARRVASVVRWGRGAEKEVKRRLSAPPRAKVLGLRKFWEGKSSQ
jgi:hypothetical protein